MRAEGGGGRGKGGEGEREGKGRDNKKREGGRVDIFLASAFALTLLPCVWSCFFWD